MTKTLENLLRGTKTVDEAYEVIRIHADELSMDDKMKIYSMVKNNGELSEDELDSVVGGGWFTNLAKKFVDFCNENKYAVATAAIALVGGVATGGIGILIASSAVATGIAAGVTAVSGIGAAVAAGGLVAGLVKSAEES